MTNTVKPWNHQVVIADHDPVKHNPSGKWWWYNIVTDTLFIVNWRSATEWWELDRIPHPCSATQYCKDSVVDTCNQAAYIAGYHPGRFDGPYAVPTEVF